MNKIQHGKLQEKANRKYATAVGNLSRAIYEINSKTVSADTIVENCPPRMVILGESFCCYKGNFSEKCQGKFCTIKQIIRGEESFKILVYNKKGE